MYEAISSPVPRKFEFQLKII